MENGEVDVSHALIYPHRRGQRPTVGGRWNGCGPHFMA
jgi:hypothetical protein